MVEVLRRQALRVAWTAILGSRRLRIPGVVTWELVVLREGVEPFRGQGTLVEVLRRQALRVAWTG